MQRSLLVMARCIQAVCETASVMLRKLIRSTEIQFRYLRILSMGLMQYSLDDRDERSVLIGLVPETVKAASYNSDHEKQLTRRHLLQVLHDREGGTASQRKLSRHE